MPIRSCGACRQLGWDDVQVVDDDLGLARNGRAWHTLLEFYGLVGTLIVEEEAIYDPRSPSDRLLLSMKAASFI